MIRFFVCFLFMFLLFPFFSQTIEINGKVLISELSGSESMIHFTNGDLSWVSLSEGIHQKHVGEKTKLFMNADEFLYFDNNNRLVGNV